MFIPAFPLPPYGSFISNNICGLSVYGFSTQCTKVSSRSKIIVFLFSYPSGLSRARALLRITYNLGRGRLRTCFSDYNTCIICNFRLFRPSTDVSLSCMDLSFVIYSFISLGFLSRNVLSKGFFYLVNL